ncbi:aromatic prenyltransferase [Streptomyces sp. NPDC058739]|uniref:aromatic prenyltransferase n=1 Tax=Streptomyces sp. NPDC058739 TaxID=3346618 RepID=UPI0036B3F518
MSERTGAAELRAVIEESVRLLDGSAPSADAVGPVLATYADAFEHDATVVAFRVATGTRHVGELDCRFTTHPEDRDPYTRALAGGLTPRTDHPVGTLLTEVRQNLPVDSYGIDFGVVGGFKKIYCFFRPDALQELSALTALPSMPDGLAANAGFFTDHGLGDRVGVIGIDYASRTVNVYFNDVPPAVLEPATVRSMLSASGFVEPSEQMLRLGESAFGLYVTLRWDTPRIERICYAVATEDLATLPVRTEPQIEKFVNGVPLSGDRKFVYGVALAPEGEYYKLESHYQWTPGAMDFI